MPSRRRLYCARCRTEAANAVWGDNMRRSAAIVCLSLVFALFLTSDALPQNSLDWTEPFPPFRIAGNLYYVGSRGLANYLITTPQGNILINSDLEANVLL